MADDAPERIWLIRMGDETVWSGDPDPNDCGILDGVEYIRADTIATLRADLAKYEVDAIHSCGEACQRPVCVLRADLAKAVDGLEWIEGICREELPLEYNDGMRKVFQRNIRDIAQSLIKELRP